MATNRAITLPNHHTPMDLIPPELAMKFTNPTYASVGVLAVLVWDIFLHLPQDYTLATQHRINSLFIIYCIARATSLAYVLGFVIVTTAPVGNCDYVRQVSILYAFAIPLSILPFVARVSALFERNKYVTAFFYLSWLSVLGGCIAMPMGSIGIKIDKMGHCFHIVTEVPRALSSVCALIHDTLIFIATSWGLMINSYSGVGVKNGIRVVVFGRDMPPFTKSILRDGQAYYLISLILNLFFVGLAYMPETSMIRICIGPPPVVIISNMSSYVYRNMRLGFYQDYTLTSTAINRAVQGPGQSKDEMLAPVFRNPMSSATRDPEDGGDLEAGHVRKAEGEVGEHAVEVTDSGNCKGVQTEKEV